MNSIKAEDEVLEMTQDDIVERLEVQLDDHCCEACRQKGITTPAVSRVTISHEDGVSEGSLIAFDLCEDHYYQLVKLIERL